MTEKFQEVIEKLRQDEVFQKETLEDPTVLEQYELTFEEYLAIRTVARNYGFDTTKVDDAYPILQVEMQMLPPCCCSCCCCGTEGIVVHHHTYPG